MAAIKNTSKKKTNSKKATEKKTKSLSGSTTAASYWGHVNQKGLYRQPSLYGRIHEDEE